MAEECVLRCDALTKRYGATLALDRLDLEVRAGEIIGLLGPNGAGKTTAMRMFTGLVRPTSGAVFALGVRVPSPAAQSGIGVVVETPAFYPWLDGRRNLEVVLAAGARVPASAVAGALAEVGLEHVGRRPVSAYSQGMRQRLAIALALARAPRLLLLDEPTNGLDQPGIRRLRQLLRRLSHEGTAVVLASHTLSEVERLCGRVAVLRRGRLVALDAVHALGGGGQRLRVRVPVHQEDAARRVLAEFRPQAREPGELVLSGVDGQRVNRLLVAQDIYAEELAVDRSGFEENYLALVRGSS